MNIRESRPFLRDAVAGLVALAVAVLAPPPADAGAASPFVFSTYLGSADRDLAVASAVDGDGNVYVAGLTTRRVPYRFPQTVLPKTNAKDEGIFVAKLSPEGELLFSTVVGDIGDESGVSSMAVDPAGNVYLAGTTRAPNFPTTAGAFQPVGDGGEFESDGFLMKLDPAGVVVYSTLIGGSDDDFVNDVAVDSAGRAVVVGLTVSSDFPTEGGFQFVKRDGLEAFVTQFEAAGASLRYSTFLGRDGGEEATAVAVSPDGRIFVAGTSTSTNLPTRGPSGLVTAQAFQKNSGGGQDAWVACFNPADSGNGSMVYLTYLGGGGTEEAFDIAVDATRRAVVTGVTGSFDFPLVGAFDNTNTINEAYVTRLNIDGTGADFSSFLGGNGQDFGNAVAIDASGRVWVAGETVSTDFPAVGVSLAPQAASRNFLVRLRSDGGALQFSSRFGGSESERPVGVGVGPDQFAIVVGQTTSPDYPTTSNAFRTAPAGRTDAYVTKVRPSRNPPTP